MMHWNYTQLLRACAFCLLLCCGATILRGQTLPQYIFSSTTGTATDMSIATTIYGAGADDNSAGGYNIGFTFVFCGSSYTQFSVSSNGNMGLGTTVVSSTLGGTYSSITLGPPSISPCWTDLHTCTNGGVYYLTSGIAPNRVLTVEWRVSNYGNRANPYTTTFQVRLYESSNKWEILYVNSNPGQTGPGQIGAQISTSNYASIVSGPPATVNYNTSASTTPLPSTGTMYSFSLCNVTATGNVAQGGTAAMSNLDSLLKGVSIQRGASQTYTPFTITGPGCSTANLTYTITGAAAADYSITPGTASVANGATSTPVVTFTPQGIGTRPATLTITSDASFTRTYYFAGQGAPRIIWTGNILQGGTLGLPNKDTLMRSIAAPRSTNTDWTPITLTNFSTNSKAAGAVITYTIKGSSGGQYIINPTSASITAGQSSTPVITFHATGIGYIVDTLTVNADGEIRLFTLRAFSQAPGIEIRSGTDLLDTTTALFRNAYGCLGEETVTIPLKITNIGCCSLDLNSIEFYRLDTTYRQGNPRYQFVRDAAGKLVRSYDYIITDTPPVVPLTANHPSTPISIGAGLIRTVYLTFIAQDIDKRFVRMYIRTNGENITNADTNGVQRIGLIWMDLYARGKTSKLSSSIAGGLPKSAQFPSTRIGDSADLSIPLFNSGDCPLRISLKSIYPVEGDVNEFSVARLPASQVDSVTKDLILAPGTSDSLVMRFKPHQTGSRRATIHLMTNDSTRQILGVTEKGVYYFDLYGSGRAGLYSQDIDFGVSLIGGKDADKIHKTIGVHNSVNGSIIISKIVVEGTDIADFTPDGNGGQWPKLPLQVSSGQKLDLGVVFNPQSGQPGARSATVKLITSDGDTILARLTGTAGTRTVTVSPLTLNFGTISAGKFVRRTITITNTGTMPLTLTQPALSLGSDYSIGSLPRLVLAPNQTEYLEITWSPVNTTSPSATLTVAGNQTNGAAQVQLQGVAVKTKRIDNGIDMSQGVNGGTNDNVNLSSGTPGGDNQSVSSVNGEELVAGMSLWQSVPNPARDQVEIRYSLAKGMDIRLELYDATGRLVKVLDAGDRIAGDQRVLVDVSDLASGSYHYRLTAGGKSIAKSMTIAR